MQGACGELAVKSLGKGKSLVAGEILIFVPLGPSIYGKMATPIRRKMRLVAL